MISMSNMASAPADRCGVNRMTRNCGTSIGYADEGLGDETYLAIGFFDHPESFAPTVHGYWAMKLPWIAFADNLPKYDSTTRDRDPAFGHPRDRQARDR